VEAFECCGVCGRTILYGERIRVYLVPAGDRRTVCELCRDRAERVGWVWEEMAGERPLTPARKRGALTTLLRGRRRKRGEGDVLVASAEAGEVAVAEGEEEEPEAEGPTARRASPDPAAPGATVGRVHPTERSPQSRLETAVEAFNGSGAARTVAGLIRSLGAPWVSVGTAAGSPSEVRITVAWELSWYQWGVDLSSELLPVRQLDKGHEVDQLDGSARQWNATAAADGGLALGTPSASAGGPAGG